MYAILTDFVWENWQKCDLKNKKWLIYPIFFAIFKNHGLGLGKKHTNVIVDIVFPKDEEQPNKPNV